LIRKTALALLAFALLFVGAAHAQSINLPNESRVDYIDYGTYANFFDDEMPVVINGVNFYISINFHTDPGSDKFDPAYSSITFWNLGTGTQANIPLTGTINTYANDILARPVIQGQFSGVYQGSFTLKLVPYYGYHHVQYWSQVTGSTLTLTGTP
jgi:hypothetical protein